MEPFKLHYPIKPYYLTQGFGAENTAPSVRAKYEAMGLKGHNGHDVAAPDGKLVLAAHEGIVTFTGEDGSGGLGVVIRTEKEYLYDGKPTYFKSIYWHLKKGSFLVKPGEKVIAGKPIARADNTGMSTGSHLHFGIKPLAKGEEDWNYWNIEQNNGYGGFIDHTFMFTGKYAEDVYPGLPTLLFNKLSAMVKAKQI